MAELGQLKKRLRGVELSGQLAGAVKTAASAKLSVLNRLYSAYRTYINAASSEFAREKLWLSLDN